MDLEFTLLLLAGSLLSGCIGLASAKFMETWQFHKDRGPILRARLLEVSSWTRRTLSIEL